ncbi:endonuclease/exonuclease/phosphatase family protein [Streptomyces sp. NPDC096324]|uniref:endonuclease/exonuclease/phosphatase family protein n=1 Tax=Streptomyces sp. NPDC096324 TaxID=3366085 RepID=UPI003807E64A
MLAVLSAVTALLTVPLTATPAHAVSRDGTSPFASYNMLGSNNGARWTNEITQLVQQVPLVALQEVGSGPPAPVDDYIRDVRIGRTRPYGQPSNYERSRWMAGGVERYVYFMQTDPQRISATGEDTWRGGRVNLATITDTPADQVYVLDNPGYNPAPNAPGDHYRDRPLLGLRFGSTWYWNAHARNRNDVQGLLRQVRDFAAEPAQHGTNWVMVGDFNVNILNVPTDDARNQLHLQAGESLLRPNRATYINGDEPSELDYAIAHGLPGGFTATVPRGAGSDHAEVHYRRTPLPAQTTVPSYTYSSRVGTITGTVMQANPNGSFGIAAPRHDNSQTARIFTTGAGTHIIRYLTGCLSIVLRMSRAASDSPIVAGSCDDPRAQWTITDPRPDPEWNQDNGGPQLWRNVAFPQLCLTPSNRQVTATRCSDDIAQRWWDNAAALPRDWPTATGNIRLESAFKGGRIMTGGYPGTGIRTAPTPPWWWWVYWLRQERLDFGWNIQRISPGDNLVRLKSVFGDNYCLGVRDEHATEQTDAMVRSCDDARGVDAAGQRWLAETYADGTVRYRNEATHLCLLAPDADRGIVILASCNDIAAERWKTVKP